MKTKLAITSLALALAGTGFAQTTTTWYYDTTDNSVAAGVTADASVDIGAAWQDTFINALTPGSINGTSPGTQATADAQLADDASWAIWSFGSLAVTDPLSSASLNVSFSANGSTPNGVTNTWTIFGYNGAVDQSTMNYTNSFSNIDQGSNYGTFQTTGSFTSDSWFSVDVTSALSAYLAGSIDGIVIGNVTDSPLFSGFGNALLLNSSEDTPGVRSGLAVTTIIPEPSTALLGALGALALLRRRR